MQLGVVIEELRNNQKNPGSVAVSFRNSKLTRLMQTFLTGHSKTIIIIAVSQDQRLLEETHNSLKFAASAQNVSLGHDRFGRSLKESSKLNISTIQEKSYSMTNMSANQTSILKSFSNFSAFDHKAEESLYFTQGSQDSGSWSSSQNKTKSLCQNNSQASDSDDYKKWRKADLIDDLVYFKDREMELTQVVLTLKNAWKEDEKRMNEERREFQASIFTLIKNYKKS